MGWKQARQIWEQCSRDHEAAARELDAARQIAEAAQGREWAARLAMIRAQDEYVRARKRPARRGRKAGGK